uniref:Uncharacterized protein MANES_18G037900 n=1 Tax=Rhizophora mucronata TaxID=61149 RepID=A0A2P2MEC8_RHIMU
MDGCLANGKFPSRPPPPPPAAASDGSLVKSLKFRLDPIFANIWIQQCLKNAFFQKRKKERRKEREKSAPYHRGGADRPVSFLFLCFSLCLLLYFEIF